MYKNKKFKKWLKKILGITSREERGRKLKEFYEITEQTKKRLLKLHNKTKELYENNNNYGGPHTKSRTVQTNRK